MYLTIKKLNSVKLCNIKNCMMFLFIPLVKTFKSFRSQIAPDGVDLFFDNVGGEWYHTILNKHLRKYGRAAICGSIENYNELEPKLCMFVSLSLVAVTFLIKL
jgi:NADPH-dependent curcumin reductase CurA